METIINVYDIHFSKEVKRLEYSIYNVGTVKATKVKSFEDIKKAKRLFYELNEYNQKGLFKEIKDLNRFIECETHLQKQNIKNNCSQESYINHHNFHVIF